LGLAPTTTGPDEKNAHEHSESEGAHRPSYMPQGKNRRLGQCSGMTPEQQRTAQMQRCESSTTFGPEQTASMPGMWIDSSS
jgi:hypothetical protein